MSLMCIKVRRYCQTLNCYPGCVHPEVRKLDELLGAEVRTDKNTFLPGGFLEAVLSNQEHPARRPLVWKNFYSSAVKRKRIAIPVKLQAENAPLYLFPEIVEEVAKYVKMSKPVRTAFQQLAPNESQNRHNCKLYQPNNPPRTRLQHQPTLSTIPRLKRDRWLPALIREKLA